MTTKMLIRSFAGGEISPELFGRLDLTKHSTGLARCLNFIVLPHGPISNRAGWEYVLETKDSTKRSVLIPFIYSTTQAYALEVGDQYIRIHTEGGTVLAASQNISAISKANPGVLTYAGSDTYTAGDVVFLTGIGGMTELNGRFVKVGTVDTGANTFTLLDLAGNNINTTSYTTYTSGGTVSEVVETATPYLEADVDDLHYTQSADVLTIVHPTYQQRQLSRASATSWPIATLSFSPTTATPAQPTVASSPASGTERTRYKITNVATDTLEESVASTAAVVGSPTAITGITLANPGVITAVGHGRSAGDAVYISGIVGTTQLNGIEFLVNTVPSADTLTIKTLDGTVVDTSAYTAWSSGGTVAMIDVINTLTTAGNKNTITLPALTAGIIRRNIYKYRNGIYAYAGQSAEGTFVDDNITPDLTQSLPEGTDPFTSSGNYPGAVGYGDGRRQFAGTTNQPLNYWATRSGTESNMTYSIPTRDDDRIAVRLNSRQAGRILHIVPVNSTILLADSAVWEITAANSDVITPSSITPKLRGSVGANNVPPIVVGDAILYGQARGGRVREMKPSETDVNGNYKSNDISIMAPHLFDRYTIVSMAYTHAPYKCAWFVRDDGVLLGLTYVPEHQVAAWHQHNTDGFYESVCAIPEGNEDVLYAIIRRTINGRTVRNVERMHTRQFTRLQDAFFVDCGVEFNNTIAATLTPGAGALTAGTEDVIFAAGSAVFASTDVDRFIHYDYEATNDEGQTTYHRAVALITEYTDSTHVKATIQAAWPSLTAIASAGWRMTVTTISGLWHLIGEEVAILADGAVHPVGTVSASATITLEQPASKGCIGLAYNSDAKTVPIAIETRAFGQDLEKNVNKLALRVNEASGVFAGPAFDKLREAKQRTSESYGLPPDLITGVMRVMTTPGWNEDGQMCIRQANPLPLTIVGLVPDSAYGG